MTSPSQFKKENAITGESWKRGQEREIVHEHVYSSWGLWKVGSSKSKANKQEKLKRKAEFHLNMSQGLVVVLANPKAT